VNKQEVPVYKEQVIGFAFPTNEGVVLRSAPLEKPVQISGYPPIVGVVQVAPGFSKLAPGVYAVAIDLSETGTETKGLLILCDSPSPAAPAPISLLFRRIPQVRNPERDAFLKKYDFKDDFPLPVDVTIQEGSACFIVLGDSAGTKATRYCTIDGSPLSVSANFTGQYSEIRSEMQQTEARLKDFLLGDTVLVTKTISEIEDHNAIKGCGLEKRCGADMLGAPVKRSSASGAGGSSTTQIIAALRVFRTMNFAGAAPILPGYYVVRTWYDGNKVFIGATISGLLNNGDKVIDQWIPAIPPAFVSDKGTADELWSEISGFRPWEGGPCIFQRKCP
jgi:hypothetical protein